MHPETMIEIVGVERAARLSSATRRRAVGAPVERQVRQRAGLALVRWGVRLGRLDAAPRPLATTAGA